MPSNKPMNEPELIHNINTYIEEEDPKYNVLVCDLSFEDTGHLIERELREN